MNVYFIRHGKTKGNLEGRYVGRTDEGLLEDYVIELKKKSMPKVDKIYVSPMKRCIETCHQLYPCSEYEIIEDFKEIDFGDFEYKSYEELNGNENYQRWIDSNGVLPFPSGESLLIFQNRCKIAFKKVIETAIESEYKEVAFVVHGGTIMAILDAYSNPHEDYFHWQVKNGCGYQGRIEVIDERMVISTLHRLFD